MQINNEIFIAGEIKKGKPVTFTFTGNAKKQTITVKTMCGCTGIEGFIKKGNLNTKEINGDFQIVGSLNTTSFNKGSGTKKIVVNPKTNNIDLLIKYIIV